MGVKMLEGLVVGLIMGFFSVIIGLIGSLISRVKFEKMLKECFVEENAENATLFTYKGKTYDREKFIQLTAQALHGRNVKKKDLEKQLAELESNLAKSESPDLDSAIIDAYRSVLEKM